MEIDYVYWDSCTIIHRFDKTPQYMDVLDEMVEKAENGKLIIVCSFFAMIECAKLPLSALPDVQEKNVVEFFANPWIQLRPVDRRIARISRDIMRKVPVQGKDAVHLATAITVENIKVFYTCDQKLLKKSGTKIPGYSLEIKEPLPMPTIQTAMTALLHEVPRVPKPSVTPKLVEKVEKEEAQDAG